MAQKSKKQARKAPAARPAVQINEEARPAPAGVAAPGSLSRSFSTDFNPDYSQTIKDLKRIGILAGSFFAILIALAFLLP
jgi:hypothetical protein